MLILLVLGRADSSNGEPHEQPAVQRQIWPHPQEAAVPTTQGPHRDPRPAVKSRRTQPMTESEFEQAVVGFAHMFGWEVAGFRPARTAKGWRTPVKYDGKGFPDLTLAHPDGRLIFAELKVPPNTQTREQMRWGQILAEYRIWVPADADQIASVLSSGRVTQWRLDMPTKRC